jgi:hypothetical protein
MMKEGDLDFNVGSCREAEAGAGVRVAGSSTSSSQGWPVHRSADKDEYLCGYLVNFENEYLLFGLAASPRSCQVGKIKEKLPCWNVAITSP